MSDLIKLEFSGMIFEKFSNVNKILPVAAELFHVDDRPTDR